MRAAVRVAFLGIAMPFLVAAACSSSKSDGPKLAVRTVSEYGGTPVSGVQVQVNGGAWAATDAAGNASFDAVPSPFTVRLHQTMTGTSGTGTGTYDFQDVWELPGLAGTEIVVPVDGSAAPSHRASVSGSVAGASGAAGTQVTVVATTAPYYSYSAGSFLAGADGTFALPEVWWEGPTSKPFGVHALESDTADPPTHYFAHGAASITASDPAGSGGSVTGVGVQLSPVAEVHATGDVAVPPALAAATLTRGLDLQLPEGAILPLSGAAGSAGAFDFTIPLVGAPAAWVSASASEGFDAVTGLLGAMGFAVRRVDLGPGTSVAGVQLDVPAPVALVAPAPGAPLTPGTVFQWTAAPDPGGRYDLNIFCEWTDPAACAPASCTRRYDLNYRGIETTATQATLPSIPSVVLPSGVTCRWSVTWSSDSLFGGTCFGDAPGCGIDGFRESVSAQRTVTVP